jgi:hypothetical protein
MKKIQHAEHVNLLVFMFIKGLLEKPEIPSPK